MKTTCAIVIYYPNLGRSLAFCKQSYEKRRNGKASRGLTKSRVNIDQRPGTVNRRDRAGDCEMGPVIGKGYSGALVTIVERRTFTLRPELRARGLLEVAQATFKLLRPYKSIAHTITADNVKELAYHEMLAKEFKAKVYFAHLHHSWERGPNENTKGLFGQGWRRGPDFNALSHGFVEVHVNQLNECPRRALGHATPLSLIACRMARVRRNKSGLGGRCFRVESA